MTDGLRNLGRVWILLTIGVLTLVFLIPKPVTADDTVVFKYKFKEGYSQDYKIKFSQDRYFGTYGTSFFSDLEVTVKCVGIEEAGNFKLEFVFNKVDASVMRGERMEENDTGAQLTGQTVSCVVSENGEVDDVKAVGYIEAWRQLEQDVTTVVKGFFAYLPAKEIAKGENWEHDDETTVQNLHVTSRSEYTYEETKKEKGRECAKVVAETEVGIGGVQSTPQGDYSAEGEGEGETEFYFDTVDGIIVKMKDKMEIKVDLTPVAGGDGFEVTRTYQIEVELL